MLEYHQSAIPNELTDLDNDDPLYYHHKNDGQSFDIMCLPFKVYNTFSEKPPPQIRSDLRFNQASIYN